MFAEMPSEDTSVQAETSQQPTAQNIAIPARVLVVEDDEILSRFLDRLLRAEGFEVEVAYDGATALDQLRPAVHLLILDLNLPNLDGIEVLRRLRTNFTDLPVLVLTARNRTDSTVLALESGADDCLIKPFSYVELLARVRALLRRRQNKPSQSSQCADLVLHRDQVRVTRNGQRIDLTPREYSLLEYLMRTPRVPVSRTVLLQEIWGADTESGTNVVDVYMKYVRDKIDLPGMSKLIRTVRGIGYAVSED